MTKKHFIMLANYIKTVKDHGEGIAFTRNQIEYLASFCQDANSNFNRERWVDYIYDKCGPNGGKVKGDK